MKAPFGWTVIRKPGTDSDFKVYKRDCPATGLAADLAPFTHSTKAAAETAGRAGDFAYKLPPKASK